MPLQNDINRNNFALWLKQCGIAALYVIFGLSVHRYLVCHDIVSIVWPGSGLALGVLLIGGRRYLWGVLLGALCLNTLVNESWWLVLGITLANVVEALLGYELLMRNHRYALGKNALDDYLKLIAIGGVAASSVGTLIAISTMILAGAIAPAEYFVCAKNWWMGNVLGVVLVAPFFIAWRKRFYKQFSNWERLEALLLIALTFVAGQIIFLGWLHEYFSEPPKNYWMFLLCTWVAIRQGSRGATLVVLLISMQFMLGIFQNNDFIAQQLSETQLNDYWFYMLILSLVSMTIATYVDSIKQVLDETRLKDTALNAAANSIIITDKAGQIEWANQAFCRISGYDHGEMLGRNHSELVHSGMQDKTFYHSLWKTILSKKVWRGELINRRKDGSLLNEEMTITPLADEQGEITHFVVVKQDISERKVSEQAWRLESEKNLALLHNASDGIHILDTYGNVIEASDSFCAMLGYQRRELIGMHISAWTVNFDTPDVQNILQQQREQPIRTQFELVHRRKDGTQFDVEISAFPLELGGEKVLFNSSRDISERKRITSQVQHTATELEQAKAQVEQEHALMAERVMERTAQLLRANKAKDSFLATMSHEIRTPLGGLLGMIELLSLSKLNHEQHSMVRTAMSSGKGLLRIVDDILDWSKIEEGKLELSPEVANVPELIKGVVNTYAQLASAKGVQLRHRIDEQLNAAYLFDSLRLSQILNNFTSNAIKFTAHGTVEIFAEYVNQNEQGVAIRLGVKDSGVGINSEQMGRLFQLYEQASSDTARMYGGTGLGLSICRSLSKLMQGEISVESTPGVGSTFYLSIRLPLANQEEQRVMQLRLARGDESDITQAVAPLITDGRLLCILIVDDHPVNRALLKQQLEQLGVQVEAAAFGIVALSLWWTGHFDLVITDCHMPEMDGYELTRSIREMEIHDDRPRIPIIAWTANVMAEEAAHCHAAGMDDLLTKPTELLVLRAMLIKWLRKG